MKSLKLYFFLSIITLLFTQDSFAQVPKKIIVEHFTNTRCGICANRNPGFYENLNNQDGILHLSIHPSSPYSNCVLNNHNTPENDARAYFYNVYGSTPKLVIHGDALPASTNYSQASIWVPYANQTSAISIHIQQEKQADLVKARVTLTTEAIHDLTDLKLVIALAEDTIFYDAPNGENEHYDVFRKALPDFDGFTVTPSIVIGESVVFDVETVVHEDWDLERIFTTVILQNEVDSKEVVQAEAVSPDLNEVINNVRTIPLLENVEISPNPMNDELTILLNDSEESTVRVFNILGNLLLEQSFIDNEKVDVSNFAEGTYFVEITNKNGRFLEKVIKL